MSIDKIPVGQGDRLKNVRINIAGKTQKEFARELGVSLAAYQNYEQDKRKFQLYHIVLLQQLYHIDPAYIPTGLNAPNPATTIGTRAESTTVPVLKKLYNHGSVSELIQKHNIGDQMIFKKASTDAFAFPVDSDSMDGGSKPIKKGDYILIEPRMELLSGDIALILLADGSVVLRQYEEQGENVKLTEAKTGTANLIPKQMITAAYVVRGRTQTDYWR